MFDDAAMTDESSTWDDEKYYDYTEPLVSNVWADEPIGWGVVVYSIIVPVICFFGIVGNTVILLVLRMKSLKESTYTYLTVLAAADLLSCILLLFSGLARGVFWRWRGWVEYDVFVYIPMCSISSNFAVLAAVGVAIDRLVIVLGPVKRRQPKFCTKTVARRFMGVCCAVAVLLNLPFFFIYTYNEDGAIVTKQLSDTLIFAVLNWMQLVLFGLFPAVFLLISNAVMICAVKKTLQQREVLLRCRQTRVGKYLRDESKLTITLVGIVFLFLIGEVPTHMASRRSAISILYAGDPSKVDKHVMEIFRLIATLLNAISCSANFIMYCLLNPKFLTNFKALLIKQDQTGNTLMRISTIRGVQQSETTLSRLSSARDCPWRF